MTLQTLWFIAMGFIIASSIIITAYAIITTNQLNKRGVKHDGK